VTSHNSGPERLATKLSFRAWLVNACLQVLQEPSHIGHVGDRAGKAHVPWSIAICQLAEETADKVEKARPMAQLGHRTPAGLAAERIWLAYNQYATSSDQ
jgi:hypothetical protein